MTPELIMKVLTPSRSTRGTMPAVISSPIHPVVDQLIDLVDEFVLPSQLLIPALATVVDPRDRRGVRHRLPTLLALSVCAVIAGARSFTAIAQWAADLAPHLSAGLGAGDTVPSESAFRRTLQRLDADHLDQVLGQWAAKRTAGFHGLRAVAVDGKSVRGARTGDGRCPHLLAAITHIDGVVLGQLNVDVKTNEIPMLPTLLDTTDLNRTIITADALHCQRSHASYLVTQRGAHYLLTVKGNQPALHSQLAGLPWADVPTRHFAGGKAHGRIEQRCLKALTVAAGINLPHAAQALRITRRTRRPRTRKWRTETVYAVTDLTAAQAQPEQLAEWIRGHWHIENQLHWVRDVTYDEDRSQIRTGHGPQVMASLRNLAISALRPATPTSPTPTGTTQTVPTDPSHYC